MRCLFYSILLFISLTSQAQIDTVYPTQYDLGYRIRVSNRNYHLVDSNLKRITKDYQTLKHVKWAGKSWYLAHNLENPSEKRSRRQKDYVGEGLLNEFGEEVTPFKYWSISGFGYLRADWAIFEDGESLHGIIDTAGRIVLEPKYESVIKWESNGFSNLIKLVKGDKSVSVMKTNGKMIVEDIGEGPLVYFKDDKFSLTSEDGEFYLYDTSGRQIIKPFYGSIYKETNESWPVGWMKYCVYPMLKDKHNEMREIGEEFCGFLDSKFQVIEEPDVPSHVLYSYHSYKNKKESIDSSWTVLISPEYERIEPFSPRRVGFAKVNREAYYVNGTKVTHIITPQYKKVLYKPKLSASENPNIWKQRDYTSLLFDYSYKIPGLDTETTPIWDVSDTILLLSGYDKGSIRFSKKGVLTMQQGKSRCGNVSFGEGVKLLLNKRRRYKESILGSYKYDFETGFIVANFRDKSYTSKILRHCWNRENTIDFELLLLSIEEL